jgi:hypothetical protein
MKNKYQFSFAILIILIGCNIFTQPKAIPELYTKIPSSISTFTAIGGGEIITNGDGGIIIKGICWSIHSSPTILDNIQISNDTSSNFICKISLLDSSTTYYIKAFASNEFGTGYGQEIIFTTLNNILVGSWKYTNNSTGDWEMIVFNKDMTFEITGSTSPNESTIGQYTFDDKFFILKFNNRDDLEFEYRLTDNSLIVSGIRTYYKQ